MVMNGDIGILDLLVASRERLKELAQWRGGELNDWALGAGRGRKQRRGVLMAIL